MKKIILLLAICGCAAMLAACGGERDEARTNPPREWGVEELGDIIVAAGTIWEDLWYHRGRFAPENFMWDTSGVPDIPPHLMGVYTPLLPSSGFDNLNDVREYLLNYYTDAKTEEMLSVETAYFAEHDGVLFAHTVRAGFSRPDWTTARHTVVERDGGRVTIDSQVTVASWHREIGDQHPTEMVYRVVMVNGRIDEIGLG